MIRYIEQSCVAFGLRVVGLVTKPYETYRMIVDRSRYGELACIGIIAGVYFFVASFVKTALFSPFLLTRQWIILFSGFILTYILVVSLFWIISSFLGRSGNLKGFVLGWGYTLVPTIAWFWMTSLLYILLPPPRSTQSTGLVFSVMYLLISITLLFWKITLSYLSLRFGLRLDLGKILLLNVIVLPLLGIYSYYMYYAGVFRIPFI